MQEWCVSPDRPTDRVERNRPIGVTENDFRESVHEPAEGARRIQPADPHESVMDIELSSCNSAISQTFILI
ncbi:hypothetical protein AArcCO_2767 [Halalkaliarchaeum sp. AArc-CO]|nr:hypothetical protein AArcCO_2767 [Halalkaliarchaeum sp. AArc-CO]